LRHWLPDLLGDEALTWIPPDTRAPRAVHKLLATWPTVPDDGSVVPALVVATALRPDAALQIPIALLERVSVGGRVVDVASVARPSFGSLFRPGRVRRGVMLAAAQRVRTWADGGLVELEQWAAVDSSMTLVTLGLRGKHLP
jgi:hypothetical protein